MASKTSWTEAENVRFQQLILQAIPNGTYTTEPPLLFLLIAQRLRKRFSPTPRLYTPDSCRAHYLTHILSHLPASSGPSEELSWSETELYSLRTHLSGALPGGLDDEEAPKSWCAIAECLLEDGLVSDAPLRLYDEDKVREQYVLRIAPRFVQEAELEEVLSWVGAGGMDGAAETEEEERRGRSANRDGARRDVLMRYLRVPSAGSSPVSVSPDGAQGEMVRSSRWSPSGWSDSASRTGGSVSGREESSRPPSKSLFGTPDRGASRGGPPLTLRVPSSGSGLASGTGGNVSDEELNRLLPSPLATPLLDNSENSSLARRAMVEYLRVPNGESDLTSVTSGSVSGEESDKSLPSPLLGRRGS